MPSNFDTVETLRELTGLVALSGHERRMIRYMKEKMTPYADEVRVDNMGNVIATLNGRDAAAPSLMVFAHMDQLGFVVRKIEADGYLRLERLGGVPGKSLLAQRMVVEAEDGTLIPAVLGTKSHHVTPQEEKYQVPLYTHLYVDIGATSREEVENQGVYVGAPVVYKPAFEVLGDRYISATSVDNRGGCFCILRILEALHQDRPQGTVYVVATVQEEYNLRGVLPAAQTLKPDLAIALDIIVSADTPDLTDLSDIALGKGPILNLYSFHGRGTLIGLIPHPSMVKHAIKCAHENDISFQRVASMGLMTDASYLQLVGEGIPAIDLSYPGRYTHSPIETVAISDLEQLAQWVTVFIQGITPDFELTRE